MADLQRRLDIVEAENDRLRERIRQLEEVLFAEESAVPFEWGLTPAERQVFGVLLGRQMATKAAIHAALYGASADDGAEPKIIDVLVCKIRRKLAPHGIAILTHWGIGFSLPAEVRARFQPRPAARRAA